MLAWLGPEPCCECGQENGGDMVSWCPECGEVCCVDCQPTHEIACWPRQPDETAAQALVVGGRTKPPASLLDWLREKHQGAEHVETTAAKARLARARAETERPF